MARRSQRSPDWKPGTQAGYAKIGTEYYIGGRAAVGRSYLETAGNLMHHGFEMLLKCVLLSKNAFTPEQLKDQFSHRLPQLWEATKQSAGQWAADHEWARFDPFIAQIHRFEDIRYGEFPNGLVKNIRAFKLSAIATLPAMPGHDQYLIDQERADELFGILLAEAGLLHPSWVREQLIGPDALADYERDNFHVISDG